jgi:CYTH domain-containing protein
VISRLAGEGRYAKLEREQRWVLDAVPPACTDERRIVDDYLVGTRLRLRKIESESATLLKLCQKVRVEEGSGERVKITNFYISLEEYNVMTSLRTATIDKTRRNFSHEDAVYAIDQFHGRHTGLVLAERELNEAEPRHTAPNFARLEVTSDDRYSGGRLAFASDEELLNLIGPAS